MKKLLILHSQLYPLDNTYIKETITLKPTPIKCIEKKSKQLKSFFLWNLKLQQLNTLRLRHFQKRYKRATNLKYRKHQLRKIPLLKKQQEILLN